MPVSNLLVVADGTAYVHNFDDQVIVRLALPAEKIGVWMLLGRALIFNNDGDAQDASARLTANDGAIELDRVDDMRIPSTSGQPVSLLGFLRPEHPAEPIVDLRCSTYNGTVNWGKLYALLVDDVRHG